MAYRADEEGGGYLPPDSQSTPQSDPFYDQVAALYAEFGRTPTPAEVEAHRGNPGGLDAVRQMLQHDQPAAPTPAVQPTGSGGGGGTDNYTTFGAGLGAPGTLTAPFTGTAPTVPNSTSYLPQTPNYTAPNFSAPVYQKPPAFELPTFAQAADDPGYQFTVKQGEQALQQSAAARGLANTGGTAKDLISYGQAAGTTQYSNVLNRMLNQYLTNVQTQYNTPYDYAYRSAVDSFAPQMAQFNANVGAGNLGYSTNAQAGQRNQEFNYNSLWDQYTNAQNYDRLHKLDIYNMVSPVLSA